MRHAGAVPSLRTTETLAALAAAVEAGVLDAEDAASLEEAWRTASGLRNAIVSVRGRASDSLPRDTRDRAALAHVRGYGSTGWEALVNDYLRVTRRARQVVDRVFWE
jgi:glutamate-ammonia-ligase adenylyltransferase